MRIKIKGSKRRRAPLDDEVAPALVGISRRINMKRNKHLPIVLAVACCISGATSIKAIAVGNGYIQTNIDLVKVNMDWTKIGSFSTKTSQNKMLTLYTSGECGLYTETNASTQQGKKVT